MEGGTIRKELLKYFKFQKDAPTLSAFCKQRSKIKPDAFYALFLIFTKIIPKSNTYKGC